MPMMSGGPWLWMLAALLAVTGLVVLIASVVGSSGNAGDEALNILRARFARGHAHVPDPSELLRDAPLRIVSLVPWRWPWRFSFSRRLELARD